MAVCVCVRAVAVISAAELWSAMEPELLQTARAHLEPDSEEEWDEEEEVTGEDEGSDRDTAIQIAQLLRDNKYR